MITVPITLYFNKGYIGHPYWPARERLITIQKESGINRSRSQDKRVNALKAYLDTHGLTLQDYHALETQAAREFYTLRDVPHGPDDDLDEIVIPAHHLNSMMAQAADQAPGPLRFARLEQIRTLVTWSDLRTGRAKADGVWERFAVVKSGSGQALSNQRGFRANAYLQDVRATGTVQIAGEDPLPKFKPFLEWTGKEIGVGASRKLGWGRFTCEWA